MNNSQPEKRSAVWVETPAIPIMLQVRKWLENKGKPAPKTMEDWTRAARLFVERTAPFN